MGLSILRSSNVVELVLGLYTHYNVEVSQVIISVTDDS